MNTDKQVRNYAARQKGWIKSNSIQPGDLVLITRAHESHSKGWNNIWTSGMTEEINKVNIINYVHKLYGIHLHRGYCYPYTILKKIWIKKRGLHFPEKGDVMVIPGSHIEIGVAEEISETYSGFDGVSLRVGIRTSPTTIHWTNYWRFATREEIIKYYNG